MSVKVNLEEAASGLLMMSESDYPFEYFSTEADVVDDRLVLRLAEKPEGTPVEKIGIDHLFRNMANPESGSVDRNTAQQFRNLAVMLKKELKEVTVYRVGEVQIEVFIIGLTAEGKVAGMRTKLIET